MKRYFGFALFFFCNISGYVWADEDVKKEGVHVVEWGVGVGGQYLNDYRGSKERQFNALPFPIVIYHGDILKIDEEEGARLEFLDNKRYEINLSGDSALRSSSDGNEKREGMPELDTAFQLGPSFNVLLNGKNFENGLLFRFPVRAEFTMDTNDFGMSYIGYTISPELTFKKQNFIPGWNLKLAAGPIYASEKTHDYYYSVEEQFVTPDRPAYDAKAGYSGTFFEAGIFGQRDNWMFQFGLRYDSLSGAEFIDSPLVETEDYYSVGFGLGWLFHKSKF